MWKSLYLCVVLIVTGSASMADVINVPGDASTIQAGIDIAMRSDEVVVAPGTYNETIDFVGRAVTLRSIDPNDPDIVAATIIDASGCCQTTVSCVSGEGADTVLSGFTITGGTGTYIETACNPACIDIYQGGGMRNVGSSPTVMNCVFVDNSAQGIGGYGIGGGVANEDGSPTFINCIFMENSATVGAGMDNSGGSPTVVDCIFIDNTGIAGGGIHNSSDSTPLISDCTFDSNGVVQTGGGMRSFNASPIVVNCTFINCSAMAGAGMFNANDAQPQVIGCTFNGNEASFQGGAMANTVIGTAPPSFPALTNCVLWGNSPNEIHDKLGSVATVTFSVVAGGFAGVGNIDSDPLFADPDRGDLRLQKNSPCIDAGDNTAVPKKVTTDLDGNPRFVDDPDTTDTGNGDPPIADMGAYEFQVVTCAADLTGDNIVGPADIAIILGNWGPVPPNDPIADLTGDGVVGPADLAIVLGNWGPCL